MYDQQAKGIFYVLKRPRFCTEVLGRKIERIDKSIANYRANLSAFIINVWSLNIVCVLIGEIAHGGLDRTTETVKRQFDRQPASPAQFVRSSMGVLQPDV